MAEFQYKRRSSAELDKRATASNNDFAGIFVDDVTQYKPKKENWIRIVPPTWGEPDDEPPHYAMEIWQHYSVGPDKATVLCLRKMKNKKCPVCEAQSKLISVGDNEEAKELKASRRMVCYVVDMNEPEKGAQIYGMPPSLDKDILKVSKDKRTGSYYSIDDPKDGYDVFFDKDGEKLQTKYVGVQLARQPSPLSKKALRHAIENPVPDMLMWRNYAEVLELLSGPEEEEAPVSRRSRRPADDVDEDDIPFDGGKKRRMARDEEEEDEPAPRKPSRRAEPEDDEEEEEPPRRAKKRVAVYEDEEEEDEPAPKRRKAALVVDDEDEDEEPAPVKKKVRRAEPEEDEEEDEPAPKPKRRVAEPDDEEEEPRSALRARLAKRSAK